MFWIGLAAGVVIGANVGIALMAIFIAGKQKETDGR